MNVLKVLAVSALLSTGLLVYSHSNAATIHVKNCADKKVKVCIWHAPDFVRLAPKTEDKLGSGESRKYSCTGTWCGFRVTGKQQGCLYRKDGSETKNGSYKPHDGKYITINWVSSKGESLYFEDSFRSCK